MFLNTSDNREVRNDEGWSGKCQPRISIFAYTNHPQITPITQTSFKKNLPPKFSKKEICVIGVNCGWPSYLPKPLTRTSDN
jgi:hypothetical protein